MSVSTICYARCSTVEQSEHWSIDAQKSSCYQYLRSTHNILKSNVAFFHDVSSGSVPIHQRHSFERIKELLPHCTFFCTVAVDRISRSLFDLLSFSKLLDSYDVSLCCIRDSFDTSTAVGSFTLHIMGAVAELERNLISERTKSGLAAAKLAGVSLGAPTWASRNQEAYKWLQSHLESFSFDRRSFFAIHRIVNSQLQLMFNTNISIPTLKSIAANKGISSSSSNFPGAPTWASRNQEAYKWLQSHINSDSFDSNLTAYSQHERINSLLKSNFGASISVPTLKKIIDQYGESNAKTT